MHSPYPDHADTLAAWRVLESFVPHQIGTLGISNTSLPTLQDLHDSATHKPAVVQNRFARRERQWDATTRAWCAARDVKYQGFWTLTANKADWQTASYVRAIAEGACVSLPMAWYALMLAVDIVVLNGTTDAVHMKEDLDGMAKVAVWRQTPEGSTRFDASLSEFKRLVRQTHS